MSLKINYHHHSDHDQSGANSAGESLYHDQDHDHHNHHHHNDHNHNDHDHDHNHNQVPSSEQCRRELGTEDGRACKAGGSRRAAGDHFDIYDNFDDHS